MKLSNIIETKPNRNLFGKGKGYTANILETEHIKADGDSAETARQKLALLLRDYFKHSDARRYFFSKTGKTVFVLYRDFCGWAYDITSAKHKHASHCGFSSDYTLEQAIESVKKHAETYEE